MWPWALVKQIQPMLKLGIILGTLLLSIIFGMIAQGNWELILHFTSGQPFGITDPVFNKEASF